MEEPGRRPTAAHCRRAGWVVVASGMVLRDLDLAARGGGVTPRWLLRVETVAFGVSGGLAALGSTRWVARRPHAGRLDATALATGSIAGAIHGARLSIFVRRRRPA